MPKTELFRAKIGSHEIRLSCCGGPGKCESGGGVLTASQESSEGYEEEIETCLPYPHALAFRNAMNEMLVALAANEDKEQREVRLRGDLTALNAAVNKIREELSRG